MKVVKERRNMERTRTKEKERQIHLGNIVRVKLGNQMQLRTKMEVSPLFLGYIKMITMLRLTIREKNECCEASGLTVIWCIDSIK
jgi:hypothetical protein